MLSTLLPIVTADPAISSVLGQKGNRDLAMPRGLVPPVLALMGGVHDPGDTYAPEGPRGSNAARSHAEPPLVVAVAPTGREADELIGALRAYLPEETVELFPAWKTPPRERLSPRSNAVARRILIQRRLAHPEDLAPLRVLVMPVRALLQPITEGLGELKPVRVRMGNAVGLESFERTLIDAAYSRVDMVEGRGQFAVHEGPVDIFPPIDPRPSRIELFGDNVEEIRVFSVADQRSLEARDEVYASPRREILLTVDVRARACELVAEPPSAVDMLDKIAEGLAPEGMESLTPVPVDMVSVVATISKGVRIMPVEPERTSQHADSLVATTEEFLSVAWSSAVAGGAMPVDVDRASFADLDETREAADKHGMGWWTLAGFFDGQGRSQVDAAEPKKLMGKVDEAIADVAGKARERWRLALAVEGAGPGRCMHEQLEEAGVPATFSEDLSELGLGVCHVTAAPIASGFTMKGQRLTLYTAADVTGRSGSSTRDMRRMPARRKNAVDFQALKPGGYVVHEHRDVGRFVKMAKHSIGASRGTQREYLVPEYASTRRGTPPDQLQAPTDSLDQVSWYAGGEAPSLNKMGGSDWIKAKVGARAATRQITQESVRPYAARQAAKGFQFPPDTPWQRELEDSFAYVETPDQLQTIDEVKADMEKPTPMDRLISGDVGYGKTEIVLRAAFEAVQDGKQVVILVPTTLLVSQHYETFRERYSDFPVCPAQLLHFQSEHEAAEIVRGLTDGTANAVTDTRRPLTGNVRFKNFGLVVVDEEQRFGVEHKEILKQLYPDVDILSMSATPIPRTLEMTVTGVCEMFTLAAPPEERHPVLAYVDPKGNKQVLAAIRRELLRDGRILYVHNRTGDMARVAAQIDELVPEAWVDVAHGKMNKHQLELVIRTSWDKEIDILVCTTIVETGLDVSNANTPIVEDAERFGLSRLHQLRGRVGRGHERACAYFLYNPDKATTEMTFERLRTIAANAELGSGIQVVMCDLGIRGAGNILGGEQFGHIAGVGFDLYVRMVADAVARMWGKAPEEEDADIDVRIGLPVDAYLPEDYVSSERLRLEIYTEIAEAGSEGEHEAIRAEMVDRYGKIPPRAERLFRIAGLREMCKEAGLAEVTMMGKNIRLAPVNLPDPRQTRLKRLYPGAILKPAMRVALVPTPGDSRRMGESLVAEGDDLFDWVGMLVHSVFVATLGFSG